jgi:hypothetical protein
MSFTIGDGVIDYNDDGNGNDFSISFSHYTKETNDEKVQEKVQEKVDDSINNINTVENYKKIDLIVDNGNIESILNTFGDNVNILESNISNNIESTQIIETQKDFSNTNEIIQKLNEKVLFSVFQSESQEIDGRAKILFNQKEYDTHNYFCNNTSKFQPKISGYYQINSGVNCFSQNGKTILIELLKNGKVYKRGIQENLLNEIINYKTVSLSSLIYLNGEDDYIEINVISSPKFLTYPGEEFTWLNGFLIH